MCKSINLNAFYKHLREKAKKMEYNKPVMFMSMTSTNSNYSLAPINTQECFNVEAPVPCAKAKGNNPMYVDNDKHIESSKINYLNDRAQNIFWNKETPLMKQFGLIDEDAPRTPKELVDRIIAGMYVLPKDDKKRFYTATDGIRWRNPATVEDNAGFDAAWEAAKAVFQDTKDTIAIGTPAEGLAAVKALDAWKPTVTATA